MTTARQFPAFLFLIIFHGQTALAVEVGQIDDFEDGTTQSWREGNPSPNPPINVATGGPAGVNDNYLENESYGDFGDLNGGTKMTTFNLNQWAGNYIAAGITHIRADIKVETTSESALQFRVGFQSLQDPIVKTSGERYATAFGYEVNVPNDGLWHEVAFEISPQALSLAGGTSTYEQVMSGVTHVRIFHGPNPGWQPLSVVATMGIDNIEAIRGADAGPDQTVLAGTLVTLDASNSDFLGATPTAYAWQFLSVPVGSATTNLSLVNPTTAMPSFTPDIEGTYNVEVEVTYGGGLTSTDTVVISAGQQPPVADAGPDQRQFPGTQVLFDGSNSSDAESSITGYSWRFLSVPPGSNVTDAWISDRNTSTPYTTLITEGRYVVELEVTDVGNLTATDTVAITMFERSVLYGIHNQEPLLSSINKLTGAVISTVAIDLPGETVTKGFGLTYYPPTNTLYAVVKLASNVGSDRTLVKVDPLTGDAEFVVNFDAPIAGMSYHFGNSMYVITGDCQTGNCTTANPSSVFEVVLPNAILVSSSPSLPLGNGSDGEAIAAALGSQTSGFLYHMSGKQGAAPGIVFEAIDMGMLEVFDIPITGPAPATDMQTMGLVYDSDRDLYIGNYHDYGAGTGELFTITPNGVRTPFAIPEFAWKDFAFRPTAARPLAPGSGDQDGDARSDILLRNTATGANHLYIMNGITIDQSVGISTVPAAWDVVGHGDYNGDGNADILWRYGPTGALWIYLMDGNALLASVFVGTVSDANWKVVGNGDYNGDGRSDILWHHAVSGTVWLYEMNSNLVIKSTGIGVVPDLNWKIVGSGDYNGDSVADILWRNVATGTNWMYLMAGSTITASTGVSVTPDLEWAIVGNGDYDGDGKSDILWRHATNGTNWLYTMNGTAIATSGSISVLPDANWTIVGDGDYNGDGKADVLWRNLATGSNWMYLMDGLTISSSANVSTVIDQNWKVVNTR